MLFSFSEFLEFAETSYEGEMNLRINPKLALGLTQIYIIRETAFFKPPTDPRGSRRASWNAQQSINSMPGRGLLCSFEEVKGSSWQSLSLKQINTKMASK